jgi:cytochrome b561
MNEGVAAWPLSLKVIHWVSAGLVFAALWLGVDMVELVHDPGRRFELTQTHKSIGVAVLTLTVVRLCLRIMTTAPTPEPAARSFLMAAKVAHIAFYVLLVAMPLSGWLMATTTPVRVPTFVFGSFELPYPLMPDLPTYRLIHAIHVSAAVLLAALIVLHIGAAFAHALFWRDRTVKRMLWERRSPG